ncbi:LacI family DNA-binding transcriptional regulator [Actinotalea sp.]|uniref:LacI family DNA-binding transcriptional regulator n=1 Tax=Actinotalea sp. TaxID=1872145 RepID=UPI003563C7C8
MDHAEEDAQPERRQPTIYDVAAAAGVAPSTVSRAFSRPGRVNAETAERIQVIAAEMGYRVNPMARALPTGRTSLLALVVSDVTNPFFFEIIRGVEAAAAEAGYVILLVNTDESSKDERTAIDRAIPLVDAILLANSRMSDNAIRMIAKQRPTVVLNRQMTDVPSLVVDNARGMRRAVEHLGTLGHRVVTYVAGPEASWADGMRWRSIREAAFELDMTARRIGPYAPTVEGGLAALVDFAEKPTTAVVTYNDLLAIGLMRGLTQHGFEVPGDVSVIGVDNIFGSDFCTPPLTTVASPLRLLGEVAVRTVLEATRQARLMPGRSRATRDPIRPAMVTTELLVRESTGPRRTPRTRDAAPRA